MAAGESGQAPELLICMRHGDRADMGTCPDSMKSWHDVATRPFDTPFVANGLAQEQVDAMKKGGVEFQAVVCSPFRRCIQTAVAAAQHAGIARISIDNRLGEFMPHVCTALKGAGLQASSFAYVSEEEAQALAGDLTVSWDRDANVPRVDEQAPELLARVQEVEMLARDCGVAQRAKGVLVVTHGDIVSMARRLWEPQEIHAVDTCGWFAVDLASRAIVGGGRLERIM